MKIFLTFLLFATQVVYGQSKIQHEPEKLFYQLDLGMSISEYVKNHCIKKILFLRDTALSSVNEFDENGNTIIQIGMENDHVRKSTHRFDDKNRKTQTKYFNSDGSFRYGYYYKFEDGIREMYKLEDSLLFRKSAYIIPENIRIYSEYNDDGTLKLKNIYVYDSTEKPLLETRFLANVISVQYRYEYLGDKKYVSKIQFDRNGTKVSEKRHLDEIKKDNKVERYPEDDERLFRIDSFDINDNLIKMELLDEDGKITRIETLEYNSNEQITTKVEVDLRRDKKISYTYQYDKFGKIELIIKKSNTESEYFRYKYETY
jgi:hypothetical protein